MRIRIVTWNINSLRARLEIVEKFVRDVKPDIVCFQETKVQDDLFPRKQLISMGFPHVEAYGQKSYNGVAICSKENIPLTDVKRLVWCGLADARHIYCVLPGDIELHNFYVPAGGDVPNPIVNDKFAHKLRFMTEVGRWFSESKKQSSRMMLLGDLNVAPLDTDVWSHKQLLSVVSHTPAEVELIERWYASQNWVDAVRRFTPVEEKLYSWWSYRSPDWEKADKGRRLDHIWVTPSIKDYLTACWVHKLARGYHKPSDHAPVVVDLDF